MANANTPFGLKPVSTVSGSPNSGAVRAYATAAGDATALYLGDVVKLAGTSQTINGSVYGDIVAAASGDVFLGVVVGVLPVTADSLKYRAASTQRILLVNVDPNALFEVQEINSGTALTANDIGLNIDLTIGSGSTVTGLSGTTLNNATEATTNTLDVKLVDFVNRVDNEIGAAAKFLVRINRHLFANQVAGA